MDNYEKRLRELAHKDFNLFSIAEKSTSVIKSRPNTVELRRWGVPYVPINYQTEVMNGLGKLLATTSPTVGLLALPTGSGKTLTATKVVLDHLAVSKGNVLWLAPQKELLYQASEAFQSGWWGGAGPGSLDIKIIDTRASYQAFDRPTCHMMTPMMAKNIFAKVNPKYSAVVFDEAHHLAADVFNAIWHQVFNNDTSLALGLSATPYRNNSTDLMILQEAFKHHLFLPKSLGYNPVSKLIEKGILSRPVYMQITGVPTTSMTKGMYDSTRLRSLVLDRIRWDRIIDCILNGTQGKTVVYAIDRMHGEYLTKSLRAFGEMAEYVDGTSGLAERNDIFERFKFGNTRVIVNVNLLIEGVDCPAAQNVVFTYPVKSPLKLQQMIGRILRGPAIGGSEESYVFSIEGGQEWLEEIIIRDDYLFTGWNVNLLE